jgi:hypothetical protein
VCVCVCVPLQTAILSPREKDNPKPTSDLMTHN